MERKPTASITTMKHIAEQAGVSTATVSRTITHPEKVSVITRNKIIQVMADMGYNAQSSSSKSRYIESHQILIIVPNICDPFFGEIIRGCETVASQNGYTVLLSDCAHQINNNDFFKNRYITHQTDGVILLGTQLLPPDNASQHHSPPIIMVNEFIPEIAIPAVHTDNMTAAFEAVNYLCQLGLRHIACIAGPEKLPLCRYRLQGYIQALRRNSIEIDPRYIVRGDFTFESGITAFRQLMTLSVAPDALFCHNDTMALGAMFQAKNSGFCIPQDLSLIGFDDIESARYSDPPLTTITQPRFDMGCEAMQLLLERLQGKQISNGSRLLDFELKIRGTTRQLIKNSRSDTPPKPGKWPRIGAY